MGVLNSNASIKLASQLATIRKEYQTMAHSFAKRYNKEKLFNIDCLDFEYFSLEDMYKDDNTVYPVRGIYPNKKSLYGLSYVLATDSCYVNLPQHLNDDCKDILNDRLAISDINRKLVGFKIYKYNQEKYNRECYSIEWVDVDPEQSSTELGEE